jgi:RNA polymerase sigma-70 factor, ECF subfamily
MHRLSPDDPDAEPSGSPIPLIDIVERLYQKDWAAFEVLYEYYKVPLGKRLLYLIGDQETAYDLYQETFVRVLRYFSGLSGVPAGATYESFEPWLYRIARNCAIDYYRHTKKFEFLQSHEDSLFEPKTHSLAEYFSIAGHEEQVCDLLCLKEALAEMSPKYRDCLLLQYHWGFSQREIAEVLDISVKTVSTNVRRGSVQLRKIYADMMNGQPTIRKGGRKQHGKINLRTF